MVLFGLEILNFKFIIAKRKRHKYKTERKRIENGNRIEN